MKKKILLSLLIISFFTVISVLNSKTAIAQKEPYEQGYGKYHSFDCGGGCY